jgi:catechol 2,3-dioxygenase-like lactoylglutathione lyase family enzyme
MPRLDRCVIAVTDWERSNRFYRAVLDATLVERQQGWAYRFGDQQLNVHGPGVDVTEVAAIPVKPGGSDLCFVWDGTADEAIAHLRRHAVSWPSSTSRSRRNRGASTSATQMARCSSSSATRLQRFPKVNARADVRVERDLVPASPCG